MTTQSNIRWAGFLYILIILLGALKVNVIEPQAVAQGLEAANKRIVNEGLFRLGIIFDILMYLFVVALSLIFYFILKPLHKNLAFTALIFRFGEALVGCTITIISGLLPLAILNGGFPNQEAPIQTLLESFLSIRESGLYMVLLFVGIGGTLFLYLFYVARLVPRILAGWGIFTYLSMVAVGFAVLLFAHRWVIIETVLFVLGALFELFFGLWLLFKGIDHQKLLNHS